MGYSAVLEIVLFVLSCSMGMLPDSRSPTIPQVLLNIFIRIVVFRQHISILNRPYGA